MKFIFFSIIILFSLNSMGVCVNVEVANLRSKPSSRAEISWVAPRYMPLLEVGRKKEWMKVKDLDGRTHWIHRKLVSYGVKCAAVKVSKANLRKGPGTAHTTTLLGSVRKYAAFRKLDRDDAWLKLRDNYGFVHWAHESTIWEPLMRSSVTF